MKLKERLKEEWADIKYVWNEISIDWLRVLSGLVMLVMWIAVLVGFHEDNLGMVATMALVILAWKAKRHE